MASAEEVETEVAAVSAEEAETEADSVVVTVNGEEIYQSELDYMVETLNNRMSLYGIDTTDETVAETIQTSALQDLVDDRLLTQDMTAQGCYDFTEDEEDAADTAAQVSWDTMIEQYEQYFTQYLGSEEDAGLSAADLAASYMSESGYTLEYMENYYRNALASEKYEEWLMQDVPEITDEEVQEGYEQRVEESKAAYENDISAFEYALQTSAEVWYRPDGYRAVLQIMMAAEGEDDEAKLASVKEKTDDIYARLEQGESFESLIAEYGEDSSFENESFMETGYQVHRESVIWEEAFVEAAYGDDMQEPGDYTQPLVFEDNVHILYYLQDVPAGQVELSEELAAALKDDLYGEKTDAKLQERLEQLTAEAEIIYAE